MSIQSDKDNLYPKYGVHHVSNGRIPAGEEFYSPSQPRGRDGRWSRMGGRGFTPNRLGVEGRSEYRRVNKINRRDSRSSYEDVVVDPSHRGRTARAYMRAKTYDESALPAYRKLIREIDDQYDFITKKLGIKVEVVSDDPYPNVEAMMDDINNNKTLKVMSTATTGSHPLFSDAQNDKFRAVHDFFGHAATGRDFSRHGERAAYLSHASMMRDPDSVRALFTETEAQNAALIATGEFQEQKLALLDDSLVFDGLVDSQPSSLAASALVAACYSAACRPPTSGGTGGSLGKARPLPDVGINDIRVAYRPKHPDGNADPGEVVWAKVPFEDDPSQSKDRPVIVIGRAKNGNLVGLQLTSKGHHRASRSVGKGSWDSSGRESFVKFDRIVQIDGRNYRKEGAAMGQDQFAGIVYGLLKHNGVKPRKSASVAGAANIVGTTMFVRIDSEVFACLTRACAPPPVGRGGSIKGGRSAVKAARKIFENASKAEAKVTETLRRVVEGSGGRLEGLEYRLKTAKSLARKIITKATERGQTPEEAAAKISDALRYTGVTEAKEYPKMIRKTIKELKKQGFSVEELETHWKRGDAYNGIHLIVKSKDGVKVEIQFHTPESLDAKGKTHPLYEQMRDPSTSPADRKRLIEEMISLADSAPVPRDALKFGDIVFRPPM